MVREVGLLVLLRSSVSVKTKTKEVEKLQDQLSEILVRKGLNIYAGCVCKL